MRAALLRPDGGLEVSTVDEPSPGPGELLVDVVAAGICGTDLHARDHGVADGTVLGHELAGRVAGLGAGVTGWSVGDPVCAMPVIACGRCGPCGRGDRVHCEAGGRLVGLGGVGGGFAERVVVGAAETWRLSDEVEPSDAALVEPLAVGLAIVERAVLAPAEAVVVIGGGPIGLAVTLWLRTLGVGDVIVSEPRSRRRQLALRCGAVATVDPTTEDLIPAVRAILGRRPDVIVEAAGVRGTVGDAFDLAPYEGRVVVAGLHGAGEVIPAAKGHHKNLSLAFSSWYRTRHFEHTVRLLGQGRIDPTALVTRRVGLDDLPATFDVLRQPNNEGKVLVTP